MAKSGAQVLDANDLVQETKELTKILRNIEKYVLFLAINLLKTIRPGQTVSEKLGR